MRTSTIVSLLIAVILLIAGCSSPESEDSDRPDEPSASSTAEDRLAQVCRKRTKRFVLVLREKASLDNFAPRSVCRKAERMRESRREAQIDAMLEGDRTQLRLIRSRTQSRIDEAVQIVDYACSQPFTFSPNATEGSGVTYMTPSLTDFFSSDYQRAKFRLLARNYEDRLSYGSFTFLPRQFRKAMFRACPKSIGNPLSIAEAKERARNFQG